MLKVCRATFPLSMIEKRIFIPLEKYNKTRRYCLFVSCITKVSINCTCNQLKLSHRNMIYILEKHYTIQLIEKKNFKRVQIPSA